MDELREPIARALARKRVIENIWRENAGQSDEAFIRRAVDYAWRDYLPDADAALAAIEASGYRLYLDHDFIEDPDPLRRSMEYPHLALQCRRCGRRNTDLGMPTISCQPGSGAPAAGG